MYCCGQCRRSVIIYQIVTTNHNFTGKVTLSLLSKDKNIDEDKRTELFEKSKGNPFFIEEWINLIKEKETFSEVLEESRGISEYAIPNSINALILARIDNLNKNLKTLLQKATIIGEDFFLQILSLTHPPINLVSSSFFSRILNKKLIKKKIKVVLTQSLAL